MDTVSRRSQARSSTIVRLLVANRGEIARRVFRTCRHLGIETIAVFSDADADLPFVAEADAAVRLPGTSPSETYLRADLVIQAARRTGADAIHPGYGFLSENASFAQALLDAGLTWVGPSPASIEAMGSKVEAKRLMEKAGVPVLGEVAPDGATQDDLPLLVKASAGGGGRGMRVVRALEELPAAVEQASAEAESAFGDATVFVEPFVQHSRHVEVQVVGDRHGQVLVLGERDCSIQRRHQKVVEESPAPDIARDVVEAMHAAARKAAEAIAYEGAGTVEFLYDPDREQFFFLEMNTRLQVEHPVTEAVTRLDLVELQLRVAEGAALDIDGVVPRGHAIEVRLYAEDPAQDWQPQSGRLTRFELDPSAGSGHRTVVTELGPHPTYGIRLDSGVLSGSEVSTFYDAMLAKVVAWAPTRRGAARMLATALSRARLHGVVTNRDLLVATLRDEDFLDGRVSTDFFERRAVVPAGEPLPPDENLLIAAAVALAERDRVARSVQSGIAVAWRNVVSQPQRTVLADARGREHVVEWYGGRTGYEVARSDVHVTAASPDDVMLEVGGVSARFAVAVDVPDAQGIHAVHVDGPLGSVSLREVPRFTDPAARVATGSMLAPMPGSIVSIAVVEDDPVTAGQTVLVLEAMKMQHTVTAPHDGVVTELPVTVGDQVASGAVLAVVQVSTGSTDAKTGSTNEGETDD